MTNEDEQELLRKISLLLKKAEGTDNEHEASAFFEKAHELMIKYAIDEARVRAEKERIEGRRMEEPVVEDYMFSSYAHHAQAKEDLLARVAVSQSVRSIPYTNRKYGNAHLVEKAGLTGLHESKWTRLVGYKNDIEHVKLLYLSLLIQSQRFAQEDWRDRYGNEKVSSWEDGHLGKFTWISAHMEGFADRIGARFKELTEIIYTQSTDGQALILDKDANILEWMYEHHLATRPKNYCYATGWPADFKVKSNSRPWYCFLEKGHEFCKVCHEELVTMQACEEHRLIHGIETSQPILKVIGYPHHYQKPVYASSSGGYGRQTSYEGRSAGQSAANRADIGLTRVGTKARIKG